MSATLVATLTTSTIAADLQYFLGAGVEKGTVDLNANGLLRDQPYSMSGETSDTTLKLKAGVILDETSRISLSHSKFSDLDSDITLILLNYDHLMSINEKTKLYAGAHLGNASYDDGYFDFKESGLAYGIQIGGIYDITEKVELEIGAAYTKYNVDKSASFSDVNNRITSYNVEMEDSTSMFVGINSKF